MDAVPFLVVSLVWAAQTGAPPEIPPSAGRAAASQSAPEEKTSPETPDERRRKQLRAQLDASVAWNEFMPSLESGERFQPVLVHRWTNDERDPQGEALGVLWTYKGRAMVAASIFPWNGRLGHELESLSRGTFLCHRDKVLVWYPEAGIPYTAVPGEAPPAETPAARLRQMKAIADRFTITMLGWNADDSDREQLRRLPKEFYRYKPEEPGLLDGAVFGFVKGTDPEAILVLEAVEAGSGKGMEWQYALARLTSGGVEARLGEQVVWRIEKHSPRNDPAKPSFSLSGELDVPPSPAATPVPASKPVPEGVVTP